MFYQQLGYLHSVQCGAFSHIIRRNRQNDFTLVIQPTTQPPNVDFILTDSIGRHRWIVAPLNHFNACGRLKRGVERKQIHVARCLQGYAQAVAKKHRRQHAGRRHFQVRLIQYLLELFDDAPLMQHMPGIIGSAHLREQIEGDLPVKELRFQRTYVEQLSRLPRKLTHTLTSLTGHRQASGQGDALHLQQRPHRRQDTGRLLQTPAEILHDLLAHLARAPVQWPDLDDYRTETAHLVLGGMLADNSISIRAAVDGLLQSCGGAWAAAMPGVAITWPPLPDDAAPALRVDKLTAQGLQATTSATGLYTALRVLYDYDHAAQRYRRAIRLQASDAIKDYGLLELEWPAPWLRTPRHAEALGQRMLTWLARPRWRVTWQHSFADVSTGAWVDMAHPLSPVQGRHRLVSAELDLSSASLSCAIEAPVGDVPAIQTTRLSSAFDPLIQPGITVDLAGSEIIFTARDEQGRPLAGAKITLNGKSTRIADSAGRVSFPVQRGRHTLLIEADGYPPSEAVVVV